MTEQIVSEVTQTTEENLEEKLSETMKAQQALEDMRKSLENGCMHRYVCNCPTDLWKKCTWRRWMDRAVR